MDSLSSDKNAPTRVNSSSVPTSLCAAEPAPDSSALKMVAYFQPSDLMCDQHCEQQCEECAKKAHSAEVQVTSAKVSTPNEQDQFRHYFVLLEKIQRDFKQQCEQGAFNEELTSCLQMMSQEPVNSRLYRRCKIITTATQVNSVSEWTALNNLNAKTLRKWLLRFINQGCSGLYDQERTGRPRKTPISLEVLQELLSRPPCAQPDYFYQDISPELQATLKKSAQWNVTLLSQVIGISRSTTYKLLRQYGILNTVN